MFGLSRAAVAVGAVGILAAAIVMGIAGVQTREIRARDRADAAERARVDTTRALAEVHLRLAVLAGGIATQMATAREAPGASVVGVSAVAFRGPAAPVIGDPDLAAVFWAPHVASADRLAFTREAGPILEESADGHTVRAGDRAEHYPVAHVAPLAGGLRYLGIDLAAPGPIARALAAAVRTREPQLTPPLAGAFGTPGVLLIEPVFGDAGESRGVVVGAIDLPGFGAHALTDLPGGAAISVVAADGSRTTIVKRGDPGTDGATTAVNAFGERWLVQVGTPHEGSGGLLPALALLTVLLAVAIAVAYVAALSRRSRTVARMVDERTREAADARAAFNAAAEAVEEWLFTLCVHPDDRLVLEFEGPGFDRLARLLPGTTAASTPGLWRSIVRPDDREACAEATRYERLATLAPVDHVYRVVASGETRHVREKLVPQRAADGRLLVHGILSDVTDVRRATEEAEHRSRTDALTGLANRHHVFDVYEIELARSERDDIPLGLVMADVDRFKTFNDRYGHLAGDRILAEVGRRLEATARPYDLVARWGGEEFCVIAPDVATDASLRRLAERLRHAVGSSPIDGHEVTISVGAVRTTDVLRSIDSITEAADRALYSAKRRGRDQVRLYGDLTVEDFVAEEPEAIRLAQALAMAASVREGMPALHCQQVADLSAAMATRLGLSDAMVMRCRIGGWLHDVGKSVIPDHILGKRGQLNAAEWQVMRNHTVIGDEIVRRIAGLGEAAPAIRSHHERYDGTGYPDRLSGTAIPIEARIVAAADAYSAITSDRVYSRGRAREEAIAELRHSAGRHLDAAVVEALVLVLYEEAMRIGSALQPAS